MNGLFLFSPLYFNLFGFIGAVEIIIKITKYPLFKHYLDIYRVGFHALCNLEGEVFMDLPKTGFFMVVFF